MATHRYESTPRLDAEALRLHALKNCAATISVLSRLLAKNGDLDLDRLGRLQEAATRMTSLLRESLERPASLDIHDLLQLVRRESEPKAHDRNVRLIVSDAASSATACSQDLREALLNLVHNAIEATPPGARVRLVHLTDGAGRSVFAISDEGPGMPTDVMRAAGRHRVRSSKAAGSGVGLALARRVIEEHGGQLAIDSSLLGTTVRVILPAPHAVRAAA